MLFRVGDVTAMIATVAFADRAGDPLHQSRHAAGAAGTDRGRAGVRLHALARLFFRVQLPVALPEIMLGINQTILMALSMIIICAMIGTRDLGQEVFIALAKADAGTRHRRRPRHRLHRHRRRPADHRLGGAAQMVKA